LRWLVGGRGTAKKSSSGNARIDRGRARWQGREVERCGAESHDEEEGKCGFALNTERIRAVAVDARGGVRQGGVVRTCGGGGLAATVGARGWKTPWWLTCGPIFPKLQLQNSQTLTSQCPKMVNIFEMINEIIKNNFPFWIHS
jgi:hypothetical protein